MLQVALPTLESTRAFGQILGKMAVKGDVILLSGDLGSGKTTLTGFIAEGLEVPAECYVVSPSFSLLLEYPGRIPLYHMDCYRLEGEVDVEGSGLIDYIVADGLTVIEWPDRLGSLQPENNLVVELSFMGEKERRALVVPHGRQWCERMRVLKKSCTAASVLLTEVPVQDQEKESWKGNQSG